MYPCISYNTVDKSSDWTLFHIYKSVLHSICLSGLSSWSKVDRITIEENKYRSFYYDYAFR